MRRALLFAVIAGLAGPGPARAQDADPVYAHAISAHREGRWSMQFEVGPDFRLQSFNGAGLAVTKNTSHARAWRFGVNASGSLLDGEQTRTIETDSTRFELGAPSLDDDRAAVAFDLLRILRAGSDRRIGLQLGFGPTIRLSRYKTRITDSQSGLSFEDRSSESRYGVLGQLGAEVFVARSLSLHAHYAAFAGYVQHTETTRATFLDAIRVREAQERAWELSMQGATLGISVYL